MGTLPQLLVCWAPLVPEDVGRGPDSDFDWLLGWLGLLGPPGTGLLHSEKK